MSTEIVKPSGIIRNLEDAERAAAAMAASGFFQDARQAAQAVVKILAGQELGFGPFAAMTGVHIIQGRPSISANLMAAAIKRSGRYDYRVLEISDTACEIAFYERGSEVGRSRFTIEDARRAGTQNLQKFPRNMLFARAISNGARWYCPDVFGGGPVYTPEELGAEVNAEGELLAPAPAPSPAPAPVVPGDVTEVAPAEPAPATPTQTEEAEVVEAEAEPEPAPTPAPAPAPTPAPAKPHWIDNPKTCTAFWAKANERGLTQADVYAALGVEHIHDYTGTLEEAEAAIKRYIEKKTGGGA